MHKNHSFALLPAVAHGGGVSTGDEEYHGNLWKSYLY